MQLVETPPCSQGSRCVFHSKCALHHYRAIHPEQCNSCPKWLGLEVSRTTPILKSSATPCETSWFGWFGIAVIARHRRHRRHRKTKEVPPPVDFAVPITAINRSPDHPIVPPGGRHSSPFVAWGISPFFGRDRWGLPAFSIRRYPCGTARGPRQARLWLVGLAALLCCAPSV